MTEAAEGTTDSSWLGLAVRAGGAERLDGALCDVVGPLVARPPVSGWAFVRFVDGEGPHLRLALGADAWSAEDVEATTRAMGEGVEGMEATPAADGLLPVPASWRRGSGTVAVEAIDTTPPDRFDEASSALVLDALPLLSGGRERFAFGLSLLTALSETALEREGRPAFWDDAARRWTGGDERGRKLLERLTEQSERLAPELVALAREMRDRDELAVLLRRHVEISSELAGAEPELVRRHAHLTCNRLGVTPLEEAVLASILAGGVATDGPPRAEEPSPVAPDADTADAPAPEGGEAIRLQQVSKDGDEARVLDDVSLTVSEGEVFAILGPPDAGKSTLLGLAAGLRVLSSGSVRVLGLDPRAERERLQQRVALGLPDEELALEGSVRENLELRARSAGGGSVDALLASTGLRDHAATKVIDLDLSARRRLAIATALVGGPEVLLLDEPTAGLSAVEREEVWAILAAHRDGGGTCVLATSSLQEARTVADRAALVVGGSLVNLASPDQLAEDHFPQRSVHFQVAEEPDRALLEDLPEVSGVRIDERPDHWAIEVETLQPDELLKLLGADPDFPQIVGVSADDIEATFTQPRGHDSRGEGA